MMLTAGVAWGERCPELPGAEELLAPGGHVLVGEIHGTHETPRQVAALLCGAARRGPARLAVELPEDEDARVAAFVRSKGRAADRERLMRGEFWRSVYQDGRRSVAMLALLDAARALRAAGADVDVVTFDAGGDDRERAMAARLAAAIARAPAATFIGLAGNLHPRKTPGRFGRSFMGEHLVAAGVKLTTVDSVYALGTAWVCTGARPEDCGPRVAGRGRAEPPAIVMRPSPDGAYDGMLAIGAPRFAAPAAVPLTAAQRAAIEALPVRLEASVAYRDKRYARCAARYAALARQPGGIADDAYQAACCFALGADLGRAFEQLGIAIDKGFRDAEHAAQDEDLARLRDDARWAKLLARMRADAK
jgi:hypothetical protein